MVQMYRFLKILLSCFVQIRSGIVAYEFALIKLNSGTCFKSNKKLPSSGYLADISDDAGK